MQLVGAVALFQARRVPRDVEMHQQPRRILEIQTFRRSVRCHQDSHWIGLLIEGVLDAFSVQRVHATKELENRCAFILVVLA